ncbi:ankyrin repeat domain-containing protein 39-like [Mizuhopecten yessoensis]|uniref:Ankyrin repeat domain-containing protein 39 n=1 Tax=Mizuhopecten yessoensis TaxID=6573 RepID=A0A210QTZ2_MIZYE|nr:ankyrin repeat domain-containing protein 39-like [Mizuhopecten yessoensis]OWF52191.1 Ankyrin repeat domain-containing protein 39 [Mizuhopecten yessoensis]
MSNNSHSCSGHFATPSVHQTLDELDFRRGIWTSALDGDVDDVEKHLLKGDSPNLTDNSGYTALHYACRHGRKAVCELLLKHGANPNSMTKSGRVTPLHRAAYCGHEEIVSLLLKNKADPLIQDEDGKTALHKAVEQGKTTVMKMIVAHCPSSTTVLDSKNRKPVECAPTDRQDNLTFLIEAEHKHKMERTT